MAVSDSERDRHLLDRLAEQLRTRQATMRHVGYEDAEVLAERLAAQLIELLGREEIERRYFVPVPRGGFIVLGMLAYALELSNDQLPPAPRRDRSVVLVDDVALTGSNLAPRLADAGADTIVALLACQPEMRRALESRDDVTACVSASDLGSTAGEFPDESAQSLWQERVPGRPLVGTYPEPVSFAWAEPDSILWNEAAGTVEPGWRFVSPERALKSRSSLGPPSPDRTARGWRFPDDLVYRRDDESLLIYRTETDEVFRLDPVGASIWGALGTLGDVDAAVAHLLTVFDAAGTSLPDDVASLADRLVDSGLLVVDAPSL